MAVAWLAGARSGRPLRFVQVGSNDGVVFDPLHSVVKAYGWSGVLLEPIPDLFAKLVANYAGYPGLEFENAAIGTSDGTVRLFTVEARPGDPYWVNQLASFDRRVVVSHTDKIADLEERVVEVEVQALTFPSLVEKHQLTSIDLVQMDVEGFDHEVIKQIDFDAPWAPDYLIFERQHMDGPTFKATRRRLRSAGYRCVNIWPDELAYRQVPPRRPGPHGAPPTGT
jgi:FkbM family methyltransferase